DEEEDKSTYEHLPMFAWAERRDQCVRCAAYEAAPTTGIGTHDGVPDMISRMPPQTQDEGREQRRENWWRRGDSHPRPKIHPRRNLRCVSASVVSFPTSRGGKTAGNPPRKISLPTSEVAVGNQPAE